MQRVILTLAVVATLALVFAGDGTDVSPILWQTIRRRHDAGEWLVLVGFVVAGVSLIASDRNSRRAMSIGLGAAGLVVAWTIWGRALGESEVFVPTLISSIPFLGLSFVKLSTLARRA